MAEEKKGMFGAAKAKPAAKSKKDDKEAVVVPGYEQKIKEYQEIGAQIADLEALYKGLRNELGDLGKEKFLELYKRDNANPNTFLIKDGDGCFMFLPMDKYIGLDEERADRLKAEYGDIITKDEKYYFNGAVLERNMETIETLLMGSPDITDADKESLIQKDVKYSIKKGTIDNLAKYGDKMSTVIDEIQIQFQVKTCGGKMADGGDVEEEDIIYDTRADDYYFKNKNSDLEAAIAKWEAEEADKYMSGGGSIIRANNSPLLKYANFEDNWHINLLELNPYRNNQSGLRYKGGNKYGVTRVSPKSGQEVFEFKTLEDAENKFNKLVELSKTFSPIRFEGKTPRYPHSHKVATQNYKIGGLMLEEGDYDSLKSLAEKMVIGNDQISKDKYLKALEKINDRGKEYFALGYDTPGKGYAYSHNDAILKASKVWKDFDVSVIVVEILGNFAQVYDIVKKDIGYKEFRSFDQSYKRYIVMTSPPVLGGDRFEEGGTPLYAGGGSPIDKYAKGGGVGKSGYAIMQRGELRTKMAISQIRKKYPRVSVVQSVSGDYIEVFSKNQNTIYKIQNEFGGDIDHDTEMDTYMLSITTKYAKGSTVKGKDFSGNYFSTNDFVGANKLEKQAEKILGKGWEAEGDVSQIESIINSLGGEYVVTVPEDRSQWNEMREQYDLANPTNDSNYDIFVISESDFKYAGGGSTVGFNPMGNSYLLYEGQSILLKTVPSPKESRFLDKEIVIEKIDNNKILKAFVRETGEKVPFFIDSNLFKIEQYAEGGGLNSFQSLLKKYNG